MAKKARGMYESTIAFLRRSYISPLPRKEPPSRTKLRRDIQKKKEDTKPMASCTAKRHTAVKAGPKDARNAKERAEMADTELFDDAAKTIQGILASDSVAIVGLEDFQLFVKRTGLEGTAKDRKVDKEKVILGFTQGKPWPRYAGIGKEWIWELSFRSTRFGPAIQSSDPQVYQDTTLLVGSRGGRRYLEQPHGDDARRSQDDFDGHSHDFRWDTSDFGTGILEQTS
jgi:hypothetical protein